MSLHSTKSLLELLMEGKHFSPRGFHAFDKQLLSHLQMLDGDAATARARKTQTPWNLKLKRQEKAADRAASDFDSLFAKQYTIDHPGGSSDWDMNSDGESWASAENAEERLTNRIQAREREHSSWPKSIHSHV